MIEVLLSLPTAAYNRPRGTFPSPTRYLTINTALGTHPASFSV